MGESKNATLRGNSWYRHREPWRHSFSTTACLCIACFSASWLDTGVSEQNKRWTNSSYEDWDWQADNCLSVWVYNGFTSTLNILFDLF